VTVLGIPFAPTSREGFLHKVDDLIAAGCGAYICEVCASSIVDASRDLAFMKALLEADVNLPDGAPVAWASRGSPGFDNHEWPARP